MANATKEIKYPTVFVPRHGSTKWNTGDPATERAKGQTDIELTAEGHKESEYDGQYLSQYPITEVHHGPLKRSAQSARHIADATGAKAVEDAPMPWDIGYLAGQLRREIADRIEYYIRNSSKAIPDGESHSDVRDRTETFLAKLLKKAESLEGSALAWVSHSDEMQIVREFITGEGAEAVEAGVGPAPATIMKLTKRGGKWRISEVGGDAADTE